MILAEFKKNLKIKIVEDDEDTLNLYSEYLSKKGYNVVGRNRKADEIKPDLAKESSDVYLIDSKLAGNKSGEEVATDILDAHPSTPILFITADNSEPEKIEKNPKFHNKKVDVLVKPARLGQIEHSILGLVSK